MKYISVAVDGPAGAGKSSVSKAVAKSLGYTYIDTGAMYRAVALFAINNGIDAKNETEKLVSHLNEVEIDIKYTDDGQQIYLLGENVSKRINQCCVISFFQRCNGSLRIVLVTIFHIGFNFLKITFNAFFAKFVISSFRS